MKKIFFLTGTLNYGGATKIMIELANYLVDFYEVSFVNYGEDEVFYNIDSRIKIYKAPVTKCKIPRIRMYHQLLLLRKYFKPLKPDLIVAFGNVEKLYACGIALFSNIKTIISERQDPFNYVVGKKRIMWKRYRMASGCVFQTVGASKYFPVEVQKKSVVIPNFIQMEKKSFIPMKEKKKEIAFSARFELKQKRQDVMINAMEIVAKMHPDWKLVFYGDGQDKETIEKMVEEKHLSDNVRFAGRVSDVNTYVYESAMMVLTSDYEGIPNVLIEAMAMGLPVISTDCSPGGARELITNGENGYLVPVGDYKKLAERILWCIDNSEQASKCGKNAQNVLEKLSPEKILPLWKQYFDDILSIGEENASK